ncbi:protein-L-isoaspartate O-methyltransferase [Thermoactinomyces sp. DSM 45892]|uniref:protein-L-isoaspartate O-methyltransferase family protein n=1 Tax=Thermoactinomyces sp. DSM 45892 TaxID=1882753 RepID=UPI0008991A02|nr:methyltransferase domain-containing protein [Thermoactinomyces sp. DSM 45892]SDY25382.1 protein-L-isoaspartate(D-aspartate) O-methyltransferase [Thermoactinomyces sp. DSM 45892]
MEVGQAMERVDEDFYIKQDGKVLQQSTARFAIQGDLELLAVEEGNKVLELGTGSGYTAALLLELIGETGKLVSLDIEPSLTERARGMFVGRNAEFHVKDGRLGWAEGAPYDRIVAWATPDKMPQAWVDQLVEGGILVSSFLMADMADTMVTTQFRKEQGVLVGKQIERGSYISMREKPDDYDLLGPALEADFVEKGPDRSFFWFSTDDPSLDPKEHFLYMKQAEYQEQVFKETEYEDFRAYFIWKRAKGRFTGSIGEISGFGLVSNGLAFVDRYGKAYSTSQPALLHLKQFVEQWGEDGKIGISQMKPVLQGLIVTLERR